MILVGLKFKVASKKAHASLLVGVFCAMAVSAKQQVQGVRSFLLYPSFDK